MSNFILQFMKEAPQGNPVVDRNIILVVTMVTSFFTPFMGSAVSIALPTIAKEFSLNAISMNWIMMSFLLSSAIFLVPFGKLADIVGRKKIFLIGNIILTLATIFCALAVSGTSLIVFRFLQGIGSALIFSSSMAIITSVYPPHERGKAIGLNVTAVYLGLSVSPVIGGFLIHVIGWRSIFYLNALAGCFIILAILLKMKAEWAEAKGEKFDFAGSIIYIFAISALMYGFSQLPKEYALILTLTGIAGFVMFVMIENWSANPVLNMRLFGQNRKFAFSNAAALINYAATFAVTTLLSLYLQYIKGMKPQQAGLFLITQPAMMAIAASFSGRLSDKYDSGKISSIGMALVVVGLTFLIFLDADTSALYLTVSLLILGLGFGLFSSPNTNAVMGSVDKKYLGIASATLATMRLSGQMISMAIANMIMHIFLGNAKINPKNFNQFINSNGVSFLVFAGLCVFGVFAALIKSKKVIES